MCTTREVRRATRACALTGAIAMFACALPAESAPPAPKPRFTQAVAFDVSPAARDLPAATSPALRSPDRAGVEPYEVRPEPDVLAPVIDSGFAGDGALDAGTAGLSSISALSIPAPLTSFEGISNQDNFNIFGFRVNPPDPVGDVGPNHYVQMVNLAFAVYD